MEVSLLTAGRDPHYALGLLETLVAHGAEVDFVADDEMESASIGRHRSVRYLNLRGDQRSDACLREKVLRIFRYYWRLIRYAAIAMPRIFHILWLNRFEWFDCTLLVLYYKALGKRLVYTAHNVSTATRDQRDGFFNEWCLRHLYHMVDHVIVHTSLMKAELLERFGLQPTKISVVPFPVNNVIPRTTLDKPAARRKLSLASSDRILLFFGNIAPYKGLEDAVEALGMLTETWGEAVRLLIVGRIKHDYAYWQHIATLSRRLGLLRHVIARTEYVDDSDVSVYFRASDVLILPYRRVYQSGVIFLSYNQGLPVIATDVGTLKESVVEGETGFICKAANPADLAARIRAYFESPLYRQLEERRAAIIDYVHRNNSWDRVADVYLQVYRCLLAA